MYISASNIMQQLQVRIAWQAHHGSDSQLLYPVIKDNVSPHFEMQRTEVFISHLFHKNSPKGMVSLAGAGLISF
jgi:hypothetical protein